MNLILVTGGLGFIGSHTVISLLESNYEVIILDSNINSTKDVLKRIRNLCKLLNIKNSNKIKFFKGDVRDKSLIEKVFIHYKKINKKIDAVIHYAGLKSIGNSFTYPLSYWENNVSGTINLLKIMDKYACRIIVFSSSASIYNAKLTSPFKENNPLGPISPYGNTKLSNEILLKEIFNYSKEKWKIANLRYFNPIGAHKKGFIGDDPIGMSSNIFPRLLECGLNDKKIFYVYGNDWPTKDGTCIRDYIHVEDVAEAHILVLKNLIKMNKRTLLNLNIGSGKGVSILELINIFQKTNNLKIEFEFTNRRKGDCAELVADSSLLNTKLNWKPKRNIEDMCRDGFNWYLNKMKFEK